MAGLFYLSDLERMGGTFRECIATKHWLLSTDVLGVISLDDKSYRTEVKLFHTGNGKVKKILGDTDQTALLTKHQEYMQNKEYASMVRSRAYFCFLALLGKLYSLGVSLFFVIRGDWSRVFFFLAVLVTCQVFTSIAHRI